MASAHRVRALSRQSRLVSIPYAVRFETAQVRDPQTKAQDKWPTAAGAVGGTVQEIFEQPTATTEHVERNLQSAKGGAAVRRTRRMEMTRDARPPPAAFSRD